MANATLLDSYFTYSTDDGVLLSTYSSTYNILLGGCRLDVDLELVFVWSRINEFLLGLK